MLLDIVLWILFGALAGWIASKIMKTDAQMGMLANIVVCMDLLFASLRVLMSKVLA